LRTKKSAWLVLLLVASVALCLPLIDKAPDDFRLTGQDFELDLLNVLSVLGIWFVLLLRLLAALASCCSTGHVVFNWFTDCLSLCWRRVLAVLFLPNELSVPCEALPLLI
jgi:hypothetical protein